MMIQFPGIGKLNTALGLLIGGFWFATILLTNKFRKLKPLHSAIFLFFLWNLASYFWTMNVDRTVARIMSYIQLGCLFLLLWDLYTTKAKLKAGLQAYVLGSYVAIGSLIYNYINGIFLSGHRFSATGIRHNELGLILALCIPIAWYLVISSENDKKTRFLQLLNCAFIPLAIFAIVLTASRGSLVSSLPAGLFILGSISRIKFSHKVLVFIALASAILLLLTSVPKSSFQRLSTTRNEIETADFNGRVAIWKQGLAVFKEHPLIGVGSSAYRSAIQLGKAPHNSFLSILVDLGIIGFSLFASVIAITIYKVLQLPKLDARFWLTVGLIWFLGATVHNWEHTKHTWLLISFMTIATNLSVWDQNEPRQVAQDSDLLAPKLN
jgi:O-antigen ligase